MDFRWLIGQGIHPDSFADILDDKLFAGIRLADLPERPKLILNTADLKTGTNFKFSRDCCGSYRLGCHPVSDLRLSQAVAYSAAFTIAFSVKRLKLSEGKEAHLTDGGVYDGLGVNALMPDKGDDSILLQKCETIITSDASFPYQENPKGVHIFFKARMESSYYCSANRNRSLIYNRLYLLHKSQEIPYLGTIKMDSRHDDLSKGWDKKDLAYINSYKTDFRPVKDRAIKLLKERGRRSAEFIVRQYLSHLK